MRACAVDIVPNLCLLAISGGKWLSNYASGLLLHPSIDEEMVDEAAVIQGHEIRFATVDLRAQAHEIRSRLLQVVGDSDDCVVKGR